METYWLSVHREKLQDAHARARAYAEKKATEWAVKHEGEVYCPEIAVGQQVYLRPIPVPTPRSRIRLVKEVVSPSDEKISVSSDVKCEVVKEPWHTAEDQFMPSTDKSMKCPSTPVDVVDAPEVEEQGSGDESLTAVERSGDESGDSVEVIPTDLVPDAVRRYPVPAQRK
ncbi:hypothetical protein ROHU_025430 [Labeo rohita]|uniref:Uncharacterized protein n=1 Tax=Labeo rohita TaxID=84645 RepID=A0A498MFS1_LABRO|nr:hypothetical protein ROHU_025430 [Labeo rohita]